MGAKRSDALVAMAESALAGDADDGLLPESTQIIVHHNIGPRGVVEGDGELRFPSLDAPTPAGGDDHPTAAPELDRITHSLAGASIEGCGVIPDWLAAKLACDSLQIDVAMIAGFPVSEPTTVRAFNRGQRRALRARDRHCRFPGCSRTRHLHAHHTKPWHPTKRTSVADAVLLCCQHHTLVHLRGYTISLGADFVTTITRPDGTILRSTPLPPTRSVRPPSRPPRRSAAGPPQHRHR